MPSVVQTGLWFSSFLLILSGYLALAATSSYTITVAAIPLALFVFAPIGEYLDEHFPWYRRISSFITALCFLSILTLPFAFSLLTGEVSLIIYIQAYLMLHRKETKSYYQLFLMTFFLILAACALSPEPEVALALLVFLVSSVASFTTLHFRAEMERNIEAQAPHWVGLNERGTGVPAEPIGLFDAGMIGAMAAVFAAALLLTSVLFVVTPRMEAGLFGRGDPALFRTGISQTVDLTQAGRIVQDQTPVMRAEFPDLPGGEYTGAMFWRVHSLAEYQKAQWSRKELGGHARDPSYVVMNALIPGMSTTTQVARQPLGDRPIVRQVLYVDRIPSEGIPCLTLAQRVRCAGNTRGMLLEWDPYRDYAVLLSRTRQSWLQYEAWSEIETFTADALRAAPTDYRARMDDGDYTLLTAQDLEPRTVALARDITRNASTVYDRAVAIMRYLNSRDFLYTLNLPALPGDHPIDAFIHQTKMGHCQLFASAMALMLRSLGVPARVAAGYRGGDWSAADRSYTVRQDMAHLWVEVYFPGLGWATFDPTPASEGFGGFAATGLGRMIARYTLRSKMFWYQNVISYNRGLQIERLRNFGLGFIELGSGLFDPERQTEFALRLRGVRFGLPLATAIGIGLVLLWFFRHTPRDPVRPLLTVEQTRAIRLYRTLQRRLRRFGADPRGKTAEELEEEAAQRLWADAGLIAETLRAYHEARFGHRPFSKDQYRAMRRRVRALRPAK